MFKNYKKEVIVIIVLISALALIVNAHLAHKEEMKQEQAVKWEGFDAFSFGEVFNWMYKQHGVGHIFTWRNNKYKVILKEEE